MRGLFLTFEGIDGCGKSTQIERAASFLKEQGIACILTREPGGSAISEQIRTLLLDPFNKNMRPQTEALLYAASRVQHLEETILPALEQGKVVLCDRFLDSSVAYQGYGRQLGAEYVRAVNAYALQYEPQLTFYFRYTPAQAQERRGGRAADRLEQENLAFFERVCEGYEQIALRAPQRVAVIEAADSIDAIAAQVCTQIQSCLRRRGI